VWSDYRDAGVSVAAVRQSKDSEQQLRLAREMRGEAAILERRCGLLSQTNERASVILALP
jgi:hypothetical protein